VIYGIFLARLRVADASIMPLDCRANTHFTSVMIGEAVAARLN
jgi:choline dehydrogenase